MPEALTNGYIPRGEASTPRSNHRVEHSSHSETETLRRLDKVAKAVEDLYQKQKEIPFYPDGMTKDELLAAGEKNPDVLSPWTYVERINGEVKAVPYHKKFERESRVVAHAARDAAKATEDRVTRELLEVLSVAFAEGNWSEFEQVWLTEDYPPNIDVLGGPLEPHMDSLLGKKAVFELVIGYIDRDSTDKTRRFVERALDVYSAQEIERRKPPPRIQVRVDNVRMAGFLRELGANASTLPNDPARGERYGYKMVLFKNNIEETFNSLLFPVIQTIFERDLVNKYQPVESAFLEASVDWLSLHEVSHPLVQHPSKQDRLLDNFAPLDELQCDVSAINLANELREANFISPQRFERILMVHIANKFVDYTRYKLLDVREKEPYARGSVAELNLLFTMAGFRPNGKFGLIRENEIIRASRSLLGYLDVLAQDATHSEVGAFFEKYGSFGTLRPFDSRLRRALTPLGEET